jgi:hypothetical protein
VFSSEATMGSDNIRHRQNQALGKLYVYMCNDLALIRDSAGLNKPCLAVGNMACFAAVWHGEQLNGDLLQDSYFS